MLHQKFIFLFGWIQYQRCFSSLIFFYQKTGATPLHIAVEHGHPKIVQILLEKGANIETSVKVHLLL